MRCMPVDTKHFPIVRSRSTCGGTLSEKRKDRKILFFYGNHFEEIQIWIRFSVNPDSEQLLPKTKKELRQSPSKLVFFFFFLAVNCFFCEVYSTLKERFTLDKTTHFVTMKCNWLHGKTKLIMIDLYRAFLGALRACALEHDSYLKISTKVPYHNTPSLWLLVEVTCRT